MKDQTVVVTFPLNDIGIIQRLFKHLRQKNRYALPEQLKEFVDKVGKYAATKHKTTVSRTTRLYRARINEDQLLNKPMKPTKMGAPPVSKANSGRTNPEGIPYLYTATDRHTAVAEVRPWEGAKVTVASIKLNRDITIVDAAARFDSEKTEENSVGAEITWNDLVSYAFTVPYEPGRSVWYLPTQFLAEHFKASGFDGISYRSGLSDSGDNLALFDPKLGKPSICELAEVEQVTYNVSFRQASSKKKA